MDEPVNLPALLCGWWCVEQKNPSRLAGVFLIRSLAMTYSHMGRPHTTIGDDAFHF